MNSLLCGHYNYFVTSSYWYFKAKEDYVLRLRQTIRNDIHTRCNVRYKKQMKLASEKYNIFQKNNTNTNVPTPVCLFIYFRRSQFLRFYSFSHIYRNAKEGKYIIRIIISLISFYFSWSFYGTKARQNYLFITRCAITCSLLDLDQDLGQGFPLEIRNGGVLCWITDWQKQHELLVGRTSEETAYSRATVQRCGREGHQTGVLYLENDQISWNQPRAILDVQLLRKVKELQLAAIYSDWRGFPLHA